MKITENKKYGIHIRLTEKQFELCLKLADSYKLSISEVIRMLIDKVIVEGDSYANYENNFKHQL